MTNSDKREPKRIDIYEEFILWSAMPPTERMKLGIETQEQFVEFYKIGINTPTAWKRRPDFEARVTAMRREWAFGKTSAVIEGIYRSCLKGNPHSQKLWLQYFHNFTEKQEINVKQHRTADIHDVFALIEFLPPEQKQKHIDWVVEFLKDASIAHEKAKAEGDTSAWDAPLPTDYKPRYKIVDLYAEEVEESDEERTDRILKELKNILPPVEPKTIPIPIPIRSSFICDPSIPIKTECYTLISKKVNSLSQR